MTADVFGYNDTGHLFFHFLKCLANLGVGWSDRSCLFLYFTIGLTAEIRLWLHETENSLQSCSVANPKDGHSRMFLVQSLK